MKNRTLLIPPVRYLAAAFLAAAFLFSVPQSAEAGKLRRLVYNNYSGSWVTNLFTTNSLGVQSFPTMPDGTDFLPNGNPGFVFPPFNAETAINTADPNTYGGWIQGYLTAPETGNYTFWLSSDDEALFFLTTDNADPLNQTKTNLLCWVPGWSSSRQWDKFPEQQSALVSLEKDKTYYLEIFHKEGTGGDHIVLGWQTPSGLLQRPMPAWHFQPIKYANPFITEPDLELIFGPVAPKAAFDYSLYDGNMAVAYANVNLDQPVTYQWMRGGVALAGETKAYYLWRANTADNGVELSVRATSGGINYTVGGAFLFVSTDAPALVSATMMPQNPTAIQVVFSEEVSSATATDTSHYTLSGSATIQSATLAADGRTVVLKTSLLTPTQVYTLNVSGIQDMATPPNTMLAASTNLIIAEGSINFRIYEPTFATDLASLRTATTNSATPNAMYINNRFISDQLITYTSIGWNIVPLRNNYVGQMIGYLTAPETGQYKFAIASDDHSILYLGTTDQRSSKREICYYNGSTGRWNLGQQLANQQSAAITLQAGQRYYIEAVYRDGTGGDGVTVCMQTPTHVANGTLMPTANSSVQANTEPFLIPPQYLSPYTAFGNLFFVTNLPPTLSAVGGTRPVLSVKVDGTLPYNYQWSKDGAPIPGANGSSYTLPFVQDSDNNAKFSVTVTNNFSSVTSVETVLSVTSDNVKPTVASVGSLLKQTIEVRFSEPVTAGTAGSTSSYLLFNSAGDPVGITGVVLDGSDPAHVTLQTAALPETDLMNLVVQNVADQSGAANIMDTSTNSFRANNFDALVSMNNSQPWSARADGNQVLITAGGADIWGTADGCVFLYKNVSGNFDYKVQGVGLAAVDQWSKMGLMGRATTAAGSRNVFNLWTAPTPFQNTYSAQIRDTTGGSSSSSNDAGTPLNAGVQPGIPSRPTLLPYPSWLRIQRIGNIFYYYYGQDGTNWNYWTYYDSSLSLEGPLPNTLPLGLAVTSHTTASTADATFASFTAMNEGPVRLTVQPTDVTVVEGANATFTATAAGNSPYSFEWLTNGVSVAPAASSGTASQTLTFTRVPFSLNGAQVAVRVTNPYNESVTSTNATLTVIKDTTAPTVRYYVLPKININPTEVKLLFSEPMNKVSAETLTSYQITTSPGGVPLGISAALLDADERTLILTTAPQTAGTTYKVVVNGVVDQACCPPNAVPANSTDYFYYAGSSGNYAQRSDGYIIMEAENAQLNEAGTSGGAVPFSRGTDPAGFSGAGYMVVSNVYSDGGTAGTAPNLNGTGAKLSFNIVFNRTGRHIVWLRGSTESSTAGNDDSAYIGFSDDGVNDWLVAMNGTATDSSLSGFPFGSWQWRSDRQTGSDPLTFTNTTTGLHKFIIWHREDGAFIDKIVIESGLRAAGNTAAPAAATGNGGLGDPESWEFIVPPPAAPTISIITPTNTQAFAAAANVPIEAAVTPVSPIAQVDFLIGTNVIGTATSAPYSMTWGSVPEGIYSLTARVTDVLGYQVTSAAVQFVVDSTKPVAYAVGSLGGTSVGVYFSDLTGMDPVSATTAANYVVNDGAVTVTNASLEHDNLAVMLSLDAPISGAFSVQIANVADRGAGPNVVVPTTLNSTVVTWALHRDVGTTNAAAGGFTDPIMPGLAQAIGTDGFYVRAGGHDIWDAADGMHFVYLPITGDFDVAARVTSLMRPDQWSKAGIMIREDLDGDSRNHLIAATPTNGVNVITVQWRPTKAATCASIATALRPTPCPIPNAWLRVTGTNNVYTFLWGTNGTDWATLYTADLSATPYGTVYVGLATTSHNNGTSLANVTAAYYRDASGFASTAAESPLLSAEVSGSNLILSWDKIGFRLETQSNPTGTGLTGSWTTVPGSTTVTEMTLPISTSAGSVFYRLANP